jgi:HK97 family phage major capsid protein
MISTNVKELTQLTQEAAVLAGKRMSRTEKDRYTFLTGTAIPAVRSGATIAEVNLLHLNDAEKRQGLPVTRSLGDATSSETRAKALFMRKMISKKVGTNELRTVLTENEGNLLTAIGTYSGLGQFVPTSFTDRVFSTMRELDPTFDPNCVTVKVTKTGSPIQTPLFDDSDQVATQISEAGDTTGDQVLLANAGVAKIGAYSWRSPLQQFSNELYQDMGEEGVADAFDTFADFAAKRCARGIGQAMLIGNGSGTTLGLIPALQAAGVNGVVAAGSSTNDGSASTGANSIGSQDLAALYFAVSEPYRSSPKCAFWLNGTTALFLSRVLDKLGRPLLNLDGPGPVMLMGKPVRISPSMSPIGSEAITVLFGNFEYWTTRLCGGYVNVLSETYAERGITAMQYVMRADGALMFAGDPANTPISYLVMHS